MSLQLFSYVKFSLDSVHQNLLKSVHFPRVKGTLFETQCNSSKFVYYDAVVIEYQTVEKKSTASC